jgi:Cys-tRNA(Pro)/Cys-tRNA(Cys) deacylase
MTGGDEGTKDTGEAAIWRRMEDVVRQSGTPYILHEHRPTRTMEDAEQNLSFDLTRIVKTIAFGTRDGGLLLAALRGTNRVAYPLLAALVGRSRRDIAPLSPQEVLARLGVEPGCVSPVPFCEAADLLIDEDVLTIAPTLYCGFGRPDRTLEIAPADLVTIAGGRMGRFSR